MGLNYLLSIFYFKMRMGEHSTDITFVIFWCHIRTCNDGCNINEQMKVDLLLKTAPIFESSNKHGTCFLYTVRYMFCLRHGASGE